MAKQTIKTRNPDRRNGKAWGKSHAVNTKALTPERQERKIHKDLDRERRKVVPQEAGSNMTMPRISWEWAAEVAAGKMIGTRKLRVVEAVFAKEREKS